MGVNKAGWASALTQRCIRFSFSPCRPLPGEYPARLANDTGRTRHHMMQLDKLPPSQRRLQRRPDFTGAQLTRFRQVFLRHGLPGLLIALAVLLLPGMTTRLWEGLAALRADPERYGLIALGVFIAAVCYACVLDRKFSPATFGWIGYLLVLSLWEEWLFRLALPGLLMELSVPDRAALLVSNLAFGVMHYFTLRWRATWCVGAFLGGMGLSNLMQLGDLAMVVLVHWAVTYINTPRPPRGNNRD